MSTATATKPEAKTNGQAKEKKEPSVRKTAKQTIAERGDKGKLAVMTQVAFALGMRNNFAGTEIEVLDKDGNATKPAGQHAVVYQITKEGGKIDKLDEKGKQWADLRAKAKACIADLSAEEQAYSKNVKTFINEVLKLQAPTESKASVLRGVTFA